MELFKIHFNKPDNSKTVVKYYMYVLKQIVYNHARVNIPELICSWISQTWNAIPSEMIAASFLKCSMTNNLDGSEDELVYNSTENTHELDDSSIENLFESDSESEFEGFAV